MKLIKHDIFTMNGRTFKVLSTLVYDRTFPPSPDMQDKHFNAIEFVEIEKQQEMGESCWVELRPKIITEPKNAMEKRYNEYANYGTIVRPNVVMYDLIEKGIINLNPKI
jgi:hypothetical protein